MFEDEWRDAPTCVGLKCSWDRYVLCTALWCGWSLAIASSAFHFAQSPSTVLAAAPFLLPCTDATDLARWLLSISCLQLLSLAVVSSLRDRRDSLQETAVFVLKGTMAVVLLLALLPALALTIVLAVSLSAYSSSSSASCLAPSASFLFVTSAVSVPLSALASLTSLYALLSIVYARLIFMQPPVKRLSSTQEADAITWIRARNGVVIPTLLIVPPTVDLSLTVPGLFPCSTVLLYSHGNAMDLGDSVYVLRAMAETFDCAVLGYEYAGYGLCQGSVSEDGCNAAIEAAYHCLVDYHHAQASQIILYGRSLGTGPSTHLAHTLQSALGGMVLQSPMLSVVRAGCRVVGRTLPFDLFPTVDLIASLTLPVFLLHGEKDTVVPFTHALALQALVSPASAFPPLWVADGDHHNMPKPWLHATEKSDSDSAERYAEKMRVNARNAVYIARMRDFIRHCRDRTEQRLQPSPVPAPALPLSTQKALLDAGAAPALALHPETEEKVAEAAVRSPVAVKHAIFGLTAEPNEPPVPTLTPMSALSHSASRSLVVPVSAVPTALSTPRSTMLPFSPVAAAGAVSLPSSLPMFGYASPTHALPSLPLSEDDSPPLHVRTQSATAALRASSRLTSYPHSRHRPRRSITVNTVERAGAVAAGYVTLERLLEDVGTREIRLVRDGGAGGGWRVERSAEDDGRTQTQGSSGEQRRARRSVSESPQQSASLAELAIAIREAEAAEPKDRKDD